MVTQRHTPPVSGPRLSGRTAWGPALQRVVTCPPPQPPSLFPSPSMMEYSLDGHNVSLSAIRTVRVLRPLRAINRVPSKWPSLPGMEQASWSSPESSPGPAGTQGQDATLPWFLDTVAPALEEGLWS